MISEMRKIVSSTDMKEHLRNAIFLLYKSIRVSTCNFSNNSSQSIALLYVGTI